MWCIWVFLNIRHYSRRARTEHLFCCSMLVSCTRGGCVAGSSPFNVVIVLSLNSLNYDIKKEWTCHTATSCVRDQHATTTPARHMWEIGSLNWAQFMLQWFISFSEFTEFSESSAPFRKNYSVFRTVIWVRPNRVSVVFSWPNYFLSWYP